MSFLRSRDYLPQIQTTILSQLTKGDLLVQVDAEEDAQEEISSYLRQRYDVTIAFASTVVFAPNAAYNAGQLAELNYPAWINQNYTAGALVSYTDGNAYLCTVNTVSDAPPTNATYWTLLGPNYGLYNIPYPYPVFDVNKGEIKFINASSHRRDMTIRHSSSLRYNKTFPCLMSSPTTLYMVLLIGEQAQHTV